jgi:hypothetical protein
MRRFPIRGTGQPYYSRLHISVTGASPRFVRTRRIADPFASILPSVQARKQAQVEPRFQLASSKNTNSRFSVIEAAATSGQAPAGELLDQGRAATQEGIGFAAFQRKQHFFGGLETLRGDARDSFEDDVFQPGRQVWPGAGGRHRFAEFWTLERFDFAIRVFAREQVIQGRADSVEIGLYAGIRFRDPA